ncbi:MAG: CapA family protein [Muribaculaceae bacterium]|nr:CapA family protein [Muribaculaceae bacterium]
MSKLPFAIVTLLGLAACCQNNAAAGSDTDTIPSEPDSADLLFVGDAMQHGPQLKQALQEGGGKYYDYSRCFTLVAPIVQQADYAVVNLEVPLGGGPTYHGYPNFSAPDAYAIALRDAGFDLFLTSNNHCLDSGMKAARRTLTALDSIGVDHIGTYSTTAQRDSLAPLIKNINGIKFAFLNYTYGTNGIPPRDGMEVALIDRDRMAAEIEKSRKKGAEIVCVTVHWGLEYMMHENESQRDLAGFLIDRGADMIIGAHPHVIQPMQVVRNEKENKDVLVVYSLGNFLSNQNDTDSRGGAMVKAHVERDSTGRATFRTATYDLHFTSKPTGRNTNYRVIPSRYADSIPAQYTRTWEMFQRNARKLLDECNVDVPYAN